MTLNSLTSINIVEWCESAVRAARHSIMKRPVLSVVLIVLHAGAYLGLVDLFHAEPYGIIAGIAWATLLLLFVDFIVMVGIDEG